MLCESTDRSCPDEANSETGSRWWGPGAGGGDGELVLNGDGVSFGEMGSSGDDVVMVVQ